uniref:Uncharacterized protein n=1 Tax=Setaria digitata TaxID=48799 RepID=A0A915PHB2_9BILA
MLKKAKKSRRSASSTTNVAVRAVQNEASPSSSRVHPCTLLRLDSRSLMYEKNTLDELRTVSVSAGTNCDDDDDDEGDAFL